MQGLPLQQLSLLLRPAFEAEDAVSRRVDPDLILVYLLLAEGADVLLGLQLGDDLWVLPEVVLYEPALGYPVLLGEAGEGSVQLL